MFRSLLIGQWPEEWVVASGRVLNWVQTLSGIESSGKKIFFPQIQVQEVSKIILVRIKIKDKNVKLFYKLFLKMKLRYICSPFK